MRENELEVLKQYDIEVKNIRKVRDAILCEADEGVFLLKEMKTSEKRLTTLEWVGKYMQSQGYENVDRILRTKEGTLFCTSEEENRYYLKKWFWGKECDIHHEKEIVDALINLARVHSLLRHVNEHEEVPALECGEDLREEFSRHNREVKKVRGLIRSKPVKGLFESTFLKSFDEQYAWADVALQQLQNSEYDKLYETACANLMIVHGEYNYHNVLMTFGGVATTNFNHIHKNIQILDFYDFLRKVMEKNHWDLRLGDKMIECYQKYLPLRKEEWELLKVCLAYPEKFWKIANSYARSKKSHLPAKSLEKLELVMEQTKEKQKFLEGIFSFQL